MDELLAAREDGHHERRATAPPRKRQVAVPGDDLRTRREDRHHDRRGLSASGGALFVAPRTCQTLVPELASRTPEMAS
jgi:hypothetical protein